MIIETIGDLIVYLKQFDVNDLVVNKYGEQLQVIKREECGFLSDIHVFD